MADLLYHPICLITARAMQCICLITARAMQCMCSIGLVCDITETQILVEFNLIKIVLAQRVQTSLQLRLEINTHSKSCHLN